MTITVNGETRQISEQSPLTLLLKDADREVGARGVAIARNGEVVRRADWNRIILEEGDMVEILRAAQGG